MIVVTELTPGLPEAYGEMSELMLAVASGRPSQRGAAQRYTLCRQALLQQADRAAVPGFLVQCASLAKFIEFITLYDPDPASRERFVARAFGATSAPTNAPTAAATVAAPERPPARRRFDIFTDDLPAERSGAWSDSRAAAHRG